VAAPTAAASQLFFFWGGVVFCKRRLFFCLFFCFFVFFLFFFISALRLLPPAPSPHPQRAETRAIRSRSNKRTSSDGEAACGSGCTPLSPPSYLSFSPQRLRLIDNGRSSRLGWMVPLVSEANGKSVVRAASTPTSRSEAVLCLADRARTLFIRADNTWSRELPPSAGLAEGAGHRGDSDPGRAVGRLGTKQCGTSPSLRFPVDWLLDSAPP